MASIYYYCPDNPKPCGGTKVIYRHVEWLGKNGREAYVLHERSGFRPTWFKAEAPVAYVDSQQITRPDDFIVLPEVTKPAVLGSLDCGASLVLFCQNHFYLFRGFLSDPRFSPRRLLGTMVVSELMRRSVEDLGLFGRVDVVPVTLSPRLFRPRKKRLQIALMPRKRPRDAQYLLACFRRQYPSHSYVPWIELDNENEAQVAKVLGESAIFLSLGYLEGLGLPALEAMSSGCFVVGYHGHGGLEYASSSNGLWCEEGNLLGCVHLLAVAVELATSGGEAYDRIVASAKRASAKFTTAAFESALSAFWGQLGDARGGK